MAKHTLYVLGGTARAGKSTVSQRMRERVLFAAPTPEALCRPILKNIFARELPGDSSEMSFRGEVIFGPPESRQKKAFDFSLDRAVTAAPSVEKDLLIELPSDYIRFIIRIIFVGENVGLSAIGFEGEKAFTAKSGVEILKAPIAIPVQGEDPIAWGALTGLIADYDRQGENDILIEGVAITPEKINSLRLENLDLKATFLGHNNEAYGPTLLAYLQNEAEKKGDYLFGEMKQSGKSEEEFVKDWMRGAVAAGDALKEQATKFGYSYFDMTALPFDEHIKAVTDFLL